MADTQADGLTPAHWGPSAGPRLFSIPSGAAFVPSFVEALLAQRLIPGFPDSSDPLALSAARIFVPTRRAARALAGEIASQLGSQLGSEAAILPQILPLGSLGEAEEASLFDPLAYAGISEAAREEAIPELERRLLLTELILQWGKQIRHAICSVEPDGRIIQDDSEPFIVTGAPGQAWHMAGELAGLIDEMIIEGVDWRALSKLAPDNFDRYWSITLEFLKIAMEHWPKYLVETGRVDAARRNVRLAEAEAQRLAETRPEAPYIVAGSTGTNAATAKLMAAIARLPNGAVVLPGLDQHMNSTSWNMLLGLDGAGASSAARETVSGHPQSALARLLQRLGVDRAAVLPLRDVPAHAAARMEFLSAAMLPPEATGQWHDIAKTFAANGLKDALIDVTYVDAESERQEAQAIALAMREALETPDRNAALITPDRSLAKRVRSELLRWDLLVDDSGGDSLREEPAGVLAGLAIQMARNIFAPVQASGEQAGHDPVAMIALLHHRDLRLGYGAADSQRIAQLVEIGLLRGPLLPLNDIASAISSARAAAQEIFAHRAKQSIGEEGWEDIEACCNRLQLAMQPLAALTGAHSLHAWFGALREACVLLMAAPEGEALAARADLEALDTLISEFQLTPDGGLEFTAPEFAAFFDRVAFETKVRGPQNAHPRLKILGLLEARLMSADVMILGGLDETVWPPAANADAFLNRPMRVELGLSPPERRIGQTAHDFVEAMGARAVIVTRARKRDGAPAIPSRLIQRMKALAGEEAWDSCCARGDRFLKLADALDHASVVRPIIRPEPKPVVALRPTQLSVTRVETWRRDPYAIFSERILKLQALDPPGVEKTPADIGNALHAAIDLYQQGAVDAELPDQARGRMSEIAAVIFEDLLRDINIKTFRWPRIVTALHSFVDWELERRPLLTSAATELQGSLDIPLADGSMFTLTARADRIELIRDGAVTLVDYKSSRAPTQKVIEAGFAPQLTLEAAIAQQGGFKPAGKGTAVREALYLTLFGKDGVSAQSIGKGRGAKKTLDELSVEHLNGLLVLANQYRSQDTPYIPRPFPQFENQYSDYDHLARVKEWSAGSDGGD